MIERLAWLCFCVTESDWAWNWYLDESGKAAQRRYFAKRRKS